MTVAIDSSEAPVPSGEDTGETTAAEQTPEADVPEARHAEDDGNGAGRLDAPDRPGPADSDGGENFWQPADAEGAGEHVVPEVIARDAREFGVYARTGGWTFALKVARSVRPGGQPAGESPKVSARRFAELAECSADRVMRFYKAWDRAADDGVVPQFEALAPGAETELPDADLWLQYYASRSSATSVRGQAITEAAEAEGIRPTKALEVAENPTALRAAILADPGTAEAARKALLDRMDEDPLLRSDLARDIVRTDDLKKAVAEESKTGDRLEYVRKIAEEGQVKTAAGQKIEAPQELREEAERHLSLIDELDEDEEAGEWAREAYDSVRTLIAETVEADPELRVQERRAKFYSSLQKASKAFEELTFDDIQEIDDIYEDDMVRRLEELQTALSACISALQTAQQKG